MRGVKGESSWCTCSSCVVLLRLRLRALRAQCVLRALRCWLNKSCKQNNEECYRRAIDVLSFDLHPHHSSGELLYLLVPFSILCPLLSPFMIYFTSLLLLYIHSSSHICFVARRMWSLFHFQMLSI